MYTTRDKATRRILLAANQFLPDALRETMGRIFTEIEPLFRHKMAPSDMAYGFVIDRTPILQIWREATLREACLESREMPKKHLKVCTNCTILY